MLDRDWNHGVAAGDTPQPLALPILEGSWIQNLDSGLSKVVCRGENSIEG